MTTRGLLFVVAFVGALRAGLPLAAQTGKPVITARPLPGTDPAKVVFEMQDALGLLRGLEQSDSVARVEYWGATGSITRNGKPSRITAFKVSLSYDPPGMRFDVTRDGVREIQVVADGFAWNEATPGGVAEPMPSAVADRRLQLWLTPIGLAKAAALAGEAVTVTHENGKTVAFFPVEGVSVRVTLNALFQPEVVEATLGEAKHTLLYTEYGELNDNAKADVYLPRRLVHKVGGATVLDLTVAHSNTYNPYVVMPVPKNVKP